MEESVEQLDPTAEINIETVKQRTASGAAILTIRTFLMQAVSFFANAILTFFLNPAQYGVFFLVSAVVNFLAYFGDIGFAAALIQKKEKLTSLELKTIFTTQQVLVLFLMVIVFLVTPIIKGVYGFNEQAIYLLWALTFSLFLSSLKTIPSVLLERRLDFNRLVIPQIVETILFNITAVFLAWKGWGITSFTVAVLVRGISGLILMYLLQPWMPAIAFSRQAISSILKFGLPYQANTLLAMVKDDGMTLFLGGVLGAQGVGLLGWAQKWAFAPLRFFMDQVIKVTFPAFSRLQDNKKELSNAVSKAIFYICLLVFPSLVMLLLLAPTLVEIIPKYSKWSPALSALAFLSITSALAAITTPLTNTFNAIGKISLTFKLMIMWTVLTWALVPALSILYGINGAAIGFALVGSSSLVALILALKYIDINYLKVAGKPLLAALIMGTPVILLRNILPASVFQVIIMIITGLIIYSVAISLIEPGLFTMLKTFLKISKKER